jgi:hypothetical protein
VKIEIGVTFFLFILLTPFLSPYLPSRSFWCVATMKLTNLAISLFLALAIAAPVEVADSLEVAELNALVQGDKPSKADKPSKGNDKPKSKGESKPGPSAEAGAADDGSCSVGFVFARGSTEPSPLVLFTQELQT